MAAKQNKSGTKVVYSQFEIVEPEHVLDLRTISISLTGYKNLFPMFPATNVMASATFLDVPLGESSKVPITDDEYLAAEHEFQLDCDINSSNDIKNLISNPIIFTITQCPGKTDASMLSHMQDPIKPPLVHSILSDESADSLVPLTDNKVDQQGTFDKTKSKGEVALANKKGSKGKVAGAGESAKSLQNEKLIDSVVMGTCLLDLIPLFLGFKMMEESLPILSEEIFYDDRMLPEKIVPHMMVKVKVDQVWIFPGHKSPNIFSVTVESLYNIPTVMSPDMQYQVCANLPNMDAKFEPTVLNDGKHTQDHNLNKYKRWAQLSKQLDVYSSTKYIIDLNTYDVRNKADVDLDQVLSQEDEPRIEWNLTKRNFLLEDGQITLLNHIRKYWHIALEIFMIPDLEKEMQQTASGKKGDKEKGSKKSDKSSKSSKGKNDGKGDGPAAFLHLMALVDVSSLLYPGVNKVRVACPVHTFQAIEACEQAGLEESHFMPKKPEVPLASAKGKGKDKNEPKKPPPPPPPPPPPEPSIKVYNEKGQPAFIIIEFEMLHPFAPKRELEELSAELEMIIPQKPPLPELVISSNIATEYYYKVIRQLIKDMTHQYQYYLDEIKNCSCADTDYRSHTNFLMFLRRNGIYQMYLSSLTKAAASMVKDRFLYKGEVNKSNPMYQNHITEVFSNLVYEMNVAFNQIVLYGLEQPPVGTLIAIDKQLLCAREACELSADALADRYYLERIARDDRNADCWFDYAIFRLELEDFDKAFECVHEALSVNILHKYSLLLYGIMLTEKEKIKEAETCFLTVMLQQPRWVEGWTILFLYYRQLNNQEGADYCMEMAQKYIHDPRVPTDYFMATDDLAWSTSICPNTIFIRTAVLLIKMRAYRYAEEALFLELPKHADVVHYMLGVIDFYITDYNSALIHLHKAEDLRGSDYALGSIIGHVLMALGLSDDAKVQYLRVLESYDRPDDVHLVYTNLAIVYDLQDNVHEARKLLLLVCNYSPTAYSWLAAGLLYYKQRDLLNAEECLTQSNLSDNILPETWAYLTIINLQLERFNEAELCYRQTLKNKLLNVDLLEKIEKIASTRGQFKKWTSVLCG